MNDREAANHWHKQALYQNRRKNLWKGRAYAATTASVLLGLLVLVELSLILLAMRGQQDVREQIDRQKFDQLVRDQEPEFAQAVGVKGANEMPAETWATIAIFCPTSNSGWFNQCSATVIDCDDNWGIVVSCGHCIGSGIGSKSWAFRPDGHTTWLQLVAFEDALHGDLSLFRMPAKYILAVAPLWNGDDHPERVCAIGYPGGRGPQITTFGNCSVGQGEWHLPLRSGRIINGSSGSGLIADGRLAGVIAGWRGNEVRTGCTFEHLEAFVANHRRKCIDCPPDNQPPAGNPPGFNPQPSGTLPPYNGKGKRPDDLNSDKKLAAAIEELRTQQAADEKEIAFLKKQVKDDSSTIDRLRTQVGKDGQDGTDGRDGKPGPQGPKGDAGPPGVAGSAGTNGTPGSQGPAGPVGPKGADGAPGAPGPAGPSGLVTIQLVDSATGKILKQAPNVKSGSTVKIPVNATVSPATQAPVTTQ